MATLLLFLFVLFPYGTTVSVNSNVIEKEYLTINEKVQLITRNLEEIIEEDEIKTILQKRKLRVYWGVATTGKPHIGYLIPMYKIADFVKAGAEVIILFADIHAFLDKTTSWKLLDYRVQYYELAIKAMLKSIGVSLQRITFVRGRDFQLSHKYTIDVYQLSSFVTAQTAQEVGAEVVKEIAQPFISGLLYPCLQALDGEYLNVDAQFGGADQKNIFKFINNYLPLLGYRKRTYLINSLLPGLTGEKMSSSGFDGKIDISDSPTNIKRKLQKAFCEPGNVTKNGLLPFIKNFIFPLLPPRQKFKVPNEANNKELYFSNYEDFEKAFEKLEIWPENLRKAVEFYLNSIMEPIRKIFNTPEIKELTAKAYPDQI